MNLKYINPFKNILIVLSSLILRGSMPFSFMMGLITSLKVRGLMQLEILGRSMKGFILRSMMKQTMIVMVSVKSLIVRGSMPPLIVRGSMLCLIVRGYMPSFIARSSRFLGTEGLMPEPIVVATGFTFTERKPAKPLLMNIKC